MYSNSNIEQLGVCSAQLKHKERVVRCRFFIIPGNSQALLGMLDIEMLESLKIMCKVLDQQLVSRTFDLRTKETSSTQRTEQTKPAPVMEVLLINV